MTEVRFDPGSKKVSGPWVKRIIDGTLALEKKKSADVSVLLTSDRKIRAIHKRYMNDDTATDVISFWVDEKHLTAKEAGYLGDLVVSVDTARRVSGELGITFKEELARYLVHGTLHLLGYEDESPRKRARMHKRQEAILKKVL